MPIRSRRRGLSLVMVMVPLSAAIVLSVAFLGVQTTSQRISQNVASGDLARQAAQAGLAAALDAMQDPVWGGVSSSLTAEVGRDSSGVWSYSIAYMPVTGDGSEIGSAAAALQIRIRSTGVWQSYTGSRPVNRVVEAVAAIVPRLPGRPPRPGDVSTTSDRASDVPGFKQAQDYALFATSGGSTATLSPQTRVSGDIYLKDRIDLFLGLQASSSQRDDLLSGYGTDYGGVSPAASPHPIAGSVKLYKNADSGQKNALNKLKSAWSTTSIQPVLPAFDPDHYRIYRLFNGGFQYTAELVGSTLQNVSLGPTDGNPLGIYWNAGSVSVGDGVKIRGTLVAGSGITISGKDVVLTAFDWRDGSGGTRVLDRSLWPVLPAVVAGDDVTFTSASRVLVEGPILTLGDFNVNTADYSEDSVFFLYTGMATARPLGGGLSEVRPLDGLASTWFFSNRHAVLLGGSTGRWYPIVSTDLFAGTVTVAGTADFPSAVDCRTSPRRVASADIIGPVLADRIEFGIPPSWQNLSSTTWSAKSSNWKTECSARIAQHIATRTFPAYLNDPSNWFSSGNPYRTYGLATEPTVCIERPANVNYACEPPLFRPDPSAEAAGGGYRWTIISWREASP